MSLDLPAGPCFHPLLPMYAKIMHLNLSPAECCQSWLASYLPTGYLPPQLAAGLYIYIAEEKQACASQIKIADTATV